ncbi:MAG: hypothetical protein ACLFVN_10385 [Phycisphaeraceae bacterium]
MKRNALTSHPRRLARRRAGFTLIEAALATVIVGTGVLAIVAAQQAYHQKNDWAQRAGTAMLLANELRERTLSLPLHDPITGASNFGPETDETSPRDYDDLDDFAGPYDAASGLGEGTTFNPPINAMGLPIEDMSRWQQVVEVGNVSAGWLDNDTLLPLGSTDMMRVTVRVQYQGPNDEEPDNVTSLTWVVGRR